MAGKDKGVLVIDIGTESIRAALVDEEGKVKRIEGRLPSFFSPHPGWAEQSPEEWWGLSSQCVKSLNLKNAQMEIVALGVTAQMHAVVPMDNKGRVLLKKVPIWCDKRSQKICEDVSRVISPQEQLNKTANLVIPNWTGPKMKWIKEYVPEAYNQASVFLTAKDYLNFKLTGNYFTDFSEASGSFLFSWKEKTWSDELLSLFDLDREKLPPIVPSVQVVGQVQEEVARFLDIPSGIPVICGAGDMLCLLLGGGMVEEGRSCDVAGTAADVSVFSPYPLISPKLMNLHHGIDGWISFGILDSGGGSLRWFRDAFYQEEGKTVFYSEIDKEAQTVGSDGLLFFPYLLGERLMGSPHARGAFLGILPHHQRRHFARAVMEGVSFDLKMSLEEIEKLWQEKILNLTAIGGGAKSDLWCQIKADIYEKEIWALEEAEGGIMGAAMLSFSSAFKQPVSQLGNEWIKVRKKFMPESDRLEVYRKEYRRFKNFHDSLQDIFSQYGKED